MEIAAVKNESKKRVTAKLSRPSLTTIHEWLDKMQEEIDLLFGTVDRLIGYYKMDQCIVCDPVTDEITALPDQSQKMFIPLLIS